MKHHLFTFAAMVSLFLWITIVVLWARSYFVCDALIHQSRSEGWSKAPPVTYAFSRSELRTLDFFTAGPDGGSWTSAALRSNAGTCRVVWTTWEFAPGRTQPFLRPREGTALHVLSLDDGVMHWPTESTGFLGFRNAFFRNRDDRSVQISRLLRSFNIQIPHWFLLFLATMLPVLWLRNYRRARRRRGLNLCPTCNYDLRATPHRCPECGLVPTPTPA